MKRVAELENQGAFWAARLGGMCGLPPQYEADSRTMFSIGHERTSPLSPSHKTLMEILDSEPHGWYLLPDGDHLLLDVNCSYSAFSFDMVVRLTPSEAQGYGVEGRPFVERLAETVQREAMTEFRIRDVAAEVGPRVLETIVAARGSRPV